MEIKEGYMPFKGYRTYYRITNPNGSKTPIIFCHGGPGSTHNFFEIFDEFAYDDDRPVVLYDQLGCGKSYVKEDLNDDLWNKETWVNELIALRKYLNLDKVHILGHSWGGMLNIIYNVDYNPKGVKSIILSSTLSSASLWKKETHRLLNLMDNRNKNALIDGEMKHEFNSNRFQNAYDKYSYRYIYGPFKKGVDPECITRKKKCNKYVYLNTWGESEFTPSGNLSSYEYTDKLFKIKSPVLILSGANDESTPLQNKIMYDEIKTKKKWVLFQDSRHMSYYEEHELYVKVLKEFLNDND
ncbi:MAG: proline iminopeptidase-family hydrolase [Acholeplasmatales bacterium]|nr:proline iminopeptidase-family hydrolase [Acholeplasmatales bacterium]